MLFIFWCIAFSSSFISYGNGFSTNKTWVTQVAKHVDIIEKHIYSFTSKSQFFMNLFLHSWKGNIMNITISVAFTQFMWRVKTVQYGPKFSITNIFCKGLQYYQKQSDKLSTFHAYTQMQQCSEKYTLWNGPQDTSNVDM